MGSGGLLVGLGAVLFLAAAVVFREEIHSAISGGDGQGTKTTTTGPKTSTDKSRYFTDPDATKPPPAELDDEEDGGEGESVFNPPFDPTSEKRYSASGTRLVTRNELAAHGPEGPLEPIWLAIAGKVYDVQRGAEKYYGKGGGYSFFSGRDGTRGYVTGDFTDEGLTDNITGLTPLQAGEIEDWVQFYDKEYKFVGKLIGRFYDETGAPTRQWYRYQKSLGQKEEIKAEQRRQQRQFPGCNSHWNEKEGGEVYCSEKSGGIHRDWVGYPRRYFAPGSTTWRCACTHPKDLDSPHIRSYPDCHSASVSCKVDPKKLREL